MNQFLELNNPQEVDIPLNNPNKTKLLINNKIQF